MMQRLPLIEEQQFVDDLLHHDMFKKIALGWYSLLPYEVLRDKMAEYPFEPVDIGADGMEVPQQRNREMAPDDARDLQHELLGGAETVDAADDCALQIV